MRKVRPVGEHDRREAESIVVAAEILVAAVLFGGINYAAYTYGGWLGVMYLWFCILLAAEGFAGIFENALTEHFEMEPDNKFWKKLLGIWFLGSLVFLGVGLL